jgi:hypothetical protein
LKRIPHALRIAAALLVAAAPVSAGAQPRDPGAHLLDVPYLAQSEALCGGAAIAMVMRYWGMTGVYAETFADLVDPEARGIRGSELLAALRARGFDARSLQGDERLVKAALAERHPPILLIEDRPGRYHYVVIVGWIGSRVVLHDPARAPFRIVEAAALGEAWQKANRWTLIANPGDDLAASPAPAGAARVEAEAPPDNPVAGMANPCSAMVAEGVRLAGANDLGASRRLLDTATAACPEDAAPWREIAGLHALKSEWGHAAAAARRALSLDPADRHAARLLATSAYVEGDPAEALDAWNRLGEPRIDLVEIQGLDRTRYAVAGAALGLRLQSMLTLDSLQRAERRLRSLPSVTGARVTYRPTESGTAVVSVAVVERSLVPWGLIPLTLLGARAAIDREAGLTVTSALGGGESWTAAWRWWENRPRVAVSLASPAPFGGVWALDAADERQAYGSAIGTVTERQRTVALRASDWVSGRTRWEGRLALERWPAGIASSAAAGLERRSLNGRGGASLSATLLAGAVRSWTFGAAVRWSSRTSNDGIVWTAGGGVAAAGADAPLALWPGAGTGQGRDVLLRAHPLLDDGIVSGGVFGRRLAHATVELHRWQSRAMNAVRLAPAAFVDIARASRVPAFADRRLHVDLGLGLRVATPLPGLLRVDVARGLRDGEMALSFGWVR